MKKAVCFVDDDADELDRFRVSMQNDYIVGAGPTLDKAMDELRAQRVKKPDLCLLDLYYGPHTNEAKRAEIGALDGQLSALEAKMRALLVEAGQSPQGGFDLAGEVQKRFPGIPRVFFSRKAFLEDALRAQKEGLPLLEKPDPTAEDIGATEKEQKDLAFQRHSEQIRRFLDGRINLNTAMKAFDVAVAFRVIIGRASMGDSQPIQSFDKARRSELRSVVGGQGHAGLPAAFWQTRQHGLFDGFKSFFRPTAMRQIPT